MEQSQAKNGCGCGSNNRKIVNPDDLKRREFFDKIKKKGKPLVFKTNKPLMM